MKNDWNAEKTCQEQRHLLFFNKMKSLYQLRADIRKVQFDRSIRPLRTL
jgi:hypothetical protein